MTDPAAAATGPRDTAGREGAGHEGADLRDRLLLAGRASGLTAVGVCGAEPFLEARAALESRRAEGLSADMAFTYRNPARSTDPARTMADVRSMVVGALRYDEDRTPRPARPAAKVARYATSDHYDRLRRALEAVAGLLRDAGHRAMVVADDNAMVDRAVAVRAGLGWYGKSSNVLLPDEGSWVVLGSVLTDADLEPTGAPLDDGCGSCRRCLDGCPTGAIVAPGMVDARRCLAWLLQSAEEFPRELRVSLGDRIYGCDDCQEVCPPSRRADRLHADLERSGDEAVSSEVSTTGGPGGWVDVDWLLVAPEDELMETVGRWYVPRRDPRFLRRNALLVAGNTGDPEDPGLVAHLEGLLDGSDEMLAGYAAWAALRLGRGDLLEPAARAERAAVAAELADPPPPRRTAVEPRVTPSDADVTTAAADGEDGGR